MAEANRSIPRCRSGELWDHIAWLAAREDFFEYKRGRR
jgi:hypothetical protein